MNQLGLTVIAILLFLCLLLSLYKYFMLKASFRDELASARKDAIEKSRNVTIGKVSEHIAPFMPGFKYNPKDARFIGSPLDFIVFDGLDEGELRKIVLVEIKTGVSNLSARERSIRTIVDNKSIVFEILRIPSAGTSGGTAVYG